MRKCHFNSEKKEGLSSTHRVFPHGGEGGMGAPTPRQIFHFSRKAQNFFCDFHAILHKNLARPPSRVVPPIHGGRALPHPWKVAKGKTLTHPMILEHFNLIQINCFPYPPEQKFLNYISSLSSTFNQLVQKWLNKPICEAVLRRKWYKRYKHQRKRTKGDHFGEKKAQKWYPITHTTQRPKT